MQWASQRPFWSLISATMNVEKNGCNRTDRTGRTAMSSEFASPASSTLLATSFFVEVVESGQRESGTLP